MSIHPNPRHAANESLVTAVSALRTVEWALDGGTVLIDSERGGPEQFVDDSQPDRMFLLDSRTDVWHSDEHAWGSGFVVTDRGSARWNHPYNLEISSAGSIAEFHLAADLRLTIDRRAGAALVEKYTFVNDGVDPIDVTALGITTPFRDLYDSAELSLKRGIHAHIWAGGDDAWVLAQPMSGTGGVLALSLTAGRLSAYSIESRNSHTMSNVRGHIVMQPTDYARNPSSFGGQTPIVIQPGHSYVVEWELRFHQSRRAFEKTLTHPVYWSELTVPLSDAVELAIPAGAVRQTGGHPATVAGNKTAVIHGTAHGTAEFEVDGVATSLFFHTPVREIVQRRVKFIIDHQIAHERRGAAAAALVPFDTRTGLTQLSTGWSDWTDGAERIAMPTLIQQAALRGWVSEADVGQVLKNWATFAKVGLLDDSGAPRKGSYLVEDRPRLYNVPWIAHFFADQYRLFGDLDDLRLAARILERSYELGARRHLSIGQPEVIKLVADLLDQNDDPDRALRLRAELVTSADYFVEQGTNLPGHEVNFEQSIVAPLVSLLATAEEITGTGRFLAHLATTVDWLRAFGGPQPHPRLRSIGIRHWDGYWFGLNRQWGDVFPHHWSVLSAVALSQLPDAQSSVEISDEIQRIFAANLIHFNQDGSATCAFVFPSTVDGIPGHRDDPLINDQDWALTLLLRSGHPLAGA